MAWSFDVEAVTLRRIDDDVREVIIHLPRLGYQESQVALVDRI